MISDTSNWQEWMGFLWPFLFWILWGKGTFHKAGFNWTFLTLRQGEPQMLLCGWIKFCHKNICGYPCPELRTWKFWILDYVPTKEIRQKLRTGHPKIKLALGYLTIVTTPDSQKHFRGPNRFLMDGMMGYPV